MSKDYISEAIEKLVDRKISQVSQEAKYAYKGKLLEDMLVPDNDTFTSIALDTDYDLEYSPVDPNSIVVYKEGTSTYYQRYSDWISSGPEGTIKFLSTGSIEAGSDIVVEYKYYRAIGSMAAADILAALLTVDGPGSGLDADLLDGVEGSGYLQGLSGEDLANLGTKEHHDLDGLDDDDHSAVYLAKDNTSPYTPASDYHPATKKYVDNASGGGSITGQFVLPCTGELSAGADVSPLPIFAGGVLTITEVYAYVKTAPVGESLIVDVNKNGTTIFTTQSNRPQISSGENSDTSGSPDVTALVKNDKLTIDIDQVGSTTPGSDLVVLIRFTQGAG
jgi:hypothetical protein